MTFNESYYMLTGLAYQKGLDSFDKIMPKNRAYNLYKAALETKGFAWVNNSFVKWILCVVGREERKLTPPCTKNCKYRMPYTQPSLQRNALRIEMFSPADRCGWKLKTGRIGGHPDDYHPCTFCGS